MVVDFVKHLKEGKSKVKQLIMGAGKTAVVTPLLSLIAGDGETFVVVMVRSVRARSARFLIKCTFEYCECCLYYFTNIVKLYTRIHHKNQHSNTNARTQVPRALLDQSRQRLRETFSTIITKRVYTLSYDRSSSPDKRFVEKLHTAVESRGVCVCT